jgi:biopolymer transport protein ExbB
MDIKSFLSDGGIILYILIFLNIIGFSLIIVKIINIFQMRYKIDTISEDIKLTINEDKNREKHIDNLIDKHLIVYEFGINTIKNIAVISPLLGLLGTVIGILLSFDTISKVGLDDPIVFSANISLALVTTVAGIVVSIPHYIFYNYYIGVLETNTVNIYNKVITKR